MVNEIIVLRILYCFLLGCKTATNFYVLTLYFAMYMQVLVLVILGNFKNLTSCQNGNSHIHFPLDLFYDFYLNYSGKEL